MKRWYTLLCSLLFVSMVWADDLLLLDTIAYEELAQNHPAAVAQLRQALYEKGIVGLKGVPGYVESVERFIAAARAFAALPEQIKESYAPNHDAGDLFLGYESGKEKFQRPDGQWVIDNLKVSYYACVPNNSMNKWPKEMDLQTPFEDIGGIMTDAAEMVMERVGLLGPETGVSLDGMERTGRLLHYRKNTDAVEGNPFWCGAHFDHGLFTALLPAFYFLDGQAISEPFDAGLFVRTSADLPFQKVLADDPSVLLFQVGEFAQLATNDQIRATEHRVHKASDQIERYTMALFFNPMNAVVHSSSVLTRDARYGAAPGESCSYLHWHEDSFRRYIVNEVANDEP